MFFFVCFFFNSNHRPSETILCALLKLYLSLLQQINGARIMR